MNEQAATIETPALDRTPALDVHPHPWRRNPSAWGQRIPIWPWMVVLFGLDVIPLGIVSAVLVVLQGTVVGDWCFLCLVTAAISLVLAVLAYDEVLSCLIYLRRVWRRGRSVRLLWDAFWGRAPRLAAEVGEEMISR